MENNDIGDNITKIKFFKRIWYSIAKPNKYNLLREDGIWVAIKYFLKISFLCVFVIAIISAFLQSSVRENAISYLNENLPEMKLKDNNLSTEDKKSTILSDDKFKEYYGVIAIIDTEIEEEKAIEKYSELVTKDYNVIIFLNDEYVIINNSYKSTEDKESSIEKNKYIDVSSKYIKDASREYNKNDIISYLKERNTYFYYFGTYFSFYFLVIVFSYFSYIVIIALAIWLVSKALKINWSFKDSIINTIYSSTLSVFVYITYLVISYFTKFTISFVDIILTILIFINLGIILSKDKKMQLSK